MSNIIDARGLQCPEPVIKTKNALVEIGEGILTVLVDSIASRDNVSRFAISQGCTIDVKEIDGYYELQLVKGFSCSISEEKNVSKNLNNKLIFVSSDSIGEDKELGKMLMVGFISNIVEVDPKLLPSKIIFVNTGVKLTCLNYDTIESLKKLEELGVEIYSCGSCLLHFKIEDELKVGKIGNAFDTIVSLLEGESVINFC